MQVLGLTDDRKRSDFPVIIRAENSTFCTIIMPHVLAGQLLGPPVQPAFVELPVAQEPKPVSTSVQPCAILKCKNGMTLEILSSATPEFLKTLIGVAAYAE